jgi:acetoacetyl-CoA synthetase
MSDASDTPRQLWQPTPQQNQQSNFARYLAWLERERGLRFTDYAEVQEWSATDIEAFWSSLFHFFPLMASRGYDTVLSTHVMPGARWFAGAHLNYVQHVFRNAAADRPALMFASERHPLRKISWHELTRDVTAVAAALRRMGITRGDRVAAYLPNIPEAVVAFLACASIGAIWSSCSPDFGTQGVVERFQQIEPRLLIAVDGYAYAGKTINRIEQVRALQRALSTVEHTVLVPYLNREPIGNGFVQWNALLHPVAALEVEQIPFDHPLWILYSSGTTGAPKAIVQGHGGILLEHFKALALQNDMKAGDRFFWFTTTGWMMWNLLLGGLLIGCTCVLYDGSPTHPNPKALWELAEDARITRFGASAAYFTTCMKAGLQPGKAFDLSSVRSIGSTGSPLPPEVFRWIYEAVKSDVWLASSSGGTDVCSAFLGACPTLPVHEGELQGRALGVRAHAYDALGRAVVNQVGELVLTEPLPSMPLFFWNDPDGSRYRESYFEMFPGVWRHGDWVRFTERGSAVIYGRSDSTLNRLGVRIGTSEIYRAVEAIPDIVDSLVIGLERPDGGYYLPLFVVMRDGVKLDDTLRERIRQHIKSTFSPRHVPDEVVQVPAIPRTLNGKKLEVPIKRILLGEPMERVLNVGSVANPEALDVFVQFADRRIGNAP